MAKVTKRQQEFLKFCVVGTLNSAIDLSVFALLFAWGIPLLPAHTLSYSCGVMNSFLLNQKWTFKESAQQQSIRQLVQFIVLNLVTLSLTYGLLLWVHTTWGFSMLVSRLFSIAGSVVINFLGSRLWVFRSANSTSVNRRTKI
ncbi:GtrA family protein [Desulfosporosinus sp. FKB]|uniref:GtrA family protein n=1 Tax=Desulfosporosinus sp. FKB TaxID=1969835 RepID=UPI000B498355|nr:GtrA family protein [Desulfosporosinus sp. FKB]